MSGDLSLSWSKMCNFFFSEDFRYPNKEYSLNVVDVFYDFTFFSRAHKTRG